MHGERRKGHGLKLQCLQQTKSAQTTAFNMFSTSRPWVRHHGMAHPQVADGETASNIEGSCEYIE